MLSGNIDSSIPVIKKSLRYDILDKKFEFKKGK